jgi:hypothetical protein
MTVGVSLSAIVNGEVANVLSVMRRNPRWKTPGLFPLAGPKPQSGQRKYN